MLLGLKESVRHLVFSARENADRDRPDSIYDVIVFENLFVCPHENGKPVFLKNSTLGTVFESRKTPLMCGRKAKTGGGGGGDDGMDICPAK